MPLLGGAIQGVLMDKFEEQGNALLRRLVISFKWMLSFLLIVLSTVYGYKVIVAVWFEGGFASAIKHNPYHAVALPLAALIALGLVLALEQKSEGIKFKAIGFEFEGASGQIVLWVMCYVAIVLSIKLFA